MLEDILRELGSSVTSMLTALAAMAGIYLAVILATRAAGPRSLAQMSAFDFVATVATGSITASVGLGSVALADGVVALATLFSLQYLVSHLRRRRTLHGAIDNTPLLLVRDGEVLEDHMRLARITPDDLRTHMRRAGETDISSVRAIVLETTGSVSVVRGEGDLGPILQGVRGADGHEGPRGQLSAG